MTIVEIAIIEIYTSVYFLLGEEEAEDAGNRNEDASHDSDEEKKAVSFWIAYHLLYHSIQFSNLCGIRSFILFRMMMSMNQKAAIAKERRERKGRLKVRVKRIKRRRKRRRMIVRRYAYCY